jgi:hypothetical protein
VETTVPLALNLPLSLARDRSRNLVETIAPLALDLRLDLVTSLNEPIEILLLI